MESLRCRKLATAHYRLSGSFMMLQRSLAHLAAMLLFAAMLVPLCDTPAFSQQADPNSTAQPTPATPEILPPKLPTELADPIIVEQCYQWIEQLGSPKFAEREAASIQLAEAGPAALTALHTALNHPDPEIQARAKMLYTRVSETWFQQRADKFLAGNTDGSDFPGWTQAKQQLGDTQDTRRLFINLSRRHPEFVEQLQEVALTRAHAAEKVADRSRDAQYQSIPPPLEDVVALLLVACDDEVKLPDGVHRRIYDLMSQVAFNEAISDPQLRIPLMKLTNTWVMRAPARSSADVISLCIQHRWAVGAQRARQVIAEKGTPDDLNWAFYALTLLGDESDIPALLPVLEDKREVYIGQDVEPFADGNGNAQKPREPGQPEPKPATPTEPRITQVRDLALSAALILARISPKEAGFPFARSNTRR